MHYRKLMKFGPKTCLKSKLKKLEGKEQSGRKLEHRNNRKGSCGAAGSVFNILMAVMKAQLIKNVLLIPQVLKSIPRNVNVALMNTKASSIIVAH